MENHDPFSLRRPAVEFDRVFDVIDDTLEQTGEGNFPAYNIERTGESEYRISLELAGFVPDEVTLTLEKNALTVESLKAEESGHRYLYRGISMRPFRRRFRLADCVEVTKTAFENGLLRIDMACEGREATNPP